MKERLNKNRIIEESQIEEIIDGKLTEMEDEHSKKNQTGEIHNHPKVHHPKHHRSLKLSIDFEERMDTIINAFGDQSTAEAIIRSLKDSPVEIQVIAKLIIDLHEKIDKTLGE